MIVRVLFSGDDSEREMLSSLFEMSFQNLGLSMEFSNPQEDLQGRTDAVVLLSMLLRKFGAHPAILVVDGEIYLAGVGSIFGCAAGRCAITTTFGLSRGAWMNVVMHGIGHILGLDHCIERCLMQPAMNEEEVERRPFALCEQCFWIAREKQRGPASEYDLHPVP